jgi:hypothetical protein
MTHLANYESRPLLSQHTSGAGVSPVINLPATAEVSHAVHMVKHIYNGGAPGVKSLVIGYTQHGVGPTQLTTKRTYTANKMETFEFAPPLVGDAGETLTIAATALAGETSTIMVFHS